MPDGLITSRPLQNEVTGIDLQVPHYQEIRGTMMTGHVEYQIIVVTRLAAFKSAKHKPEDIVQLVVSKKYSEIDEFYYRLMGQYPKITLPAMPRKALFVGEADIRERRVAFDELVKFISKNSTLATCPEVLELLGAKSTMADLKTRNVADWQDQDKEEGLNFFESEETPAAAAKVTKHVPPVKPREEEQEHDDDDEYLGPLGNLKCTRQKKKKPPQAKVSTQPKLSLFDEAEDIDDDLFQPAAKDSNVKLFKEPDLIGKVKLGDPLLLPTAYKDVASADSGLDEDTDELFRIEDNFDKLLQLKKSIKARPVPARKPKLAPKPKLPVKPSSLVSGGGGPVVGVLPVADEVKDQIDILKYIQQNESTSIDDLDLF